MTSRERVRRAIDHQEPDRVPLDLGSTLVTGIAASVYAKLKKTLGIEGRKLLRPDDLYDDLKVFNAFPKSLQRSFNLSIRRRLSLLRS